MFKPVKHEIPRDDNNNNDDTVSHNNTISRADTCVLK